MPGGMGGMPGGMGGMPGGMGGMPGGMGGQPGGQGGQNQMQQQFLMKLLSNPKTAAYFQDEDFRTKLMDIQQNPMNFQKYMSDPKIMEAMKVITEGMDMSKMAGDMGMAEEDLPNKEAPTFETKAPEPPKPQPSQTLNQAETEKNLGNAAYKNKDFNLAIEHYDKAIELAHKNLLYRSNKCAVLIELKEWEKINELVAEGQKVFSESDYSDRNPVHLAKLLGRKGRALWLQGDYDSAIQVYEDALMEATESSLQIDLKELKKLKSEKARLDYLSPEIGDKHRELGIENFKAGKWAEAIAEFDEALKRNPKDYKAHANKSSCYIKLLEFNIALAEAEKAIALEPTYTKAHLRKAAVHKFLKEFHKALDAYDKVLKLDPENQEAKEGKQKVQMDIMSSMHETGNDEDRLKRAMQDPEIQCIMMDPMVKIALQQMQTSPKDAQSYFQDATLGPKLQKLIQAGVLKVA